MSLHKQTIRTYFFTTLSLLRVVVSTLTELSFTGDDEKLRFCTSLPSFEDLYKVSSYIERRHISLYKFKEFIIILVKVRLVVLHQDLAYRVRIS